MRLYYKTSAVHERGLVRLLRSHLPIIPTYWLPGRVQRNIGPHVCQLEMSYPSVKELAHCNSLKHPLTSKSIYHMTYNHVPGKCRNSRSCCKSQCQNRVACSIYPSSACASGRFRALQSTISCAPMRFSDLTPYPLKGL